MDVLRLSFDGLEETEKEIFLHIACFFKHRTQEYVMNILNCCGFQADIGLRVLVDKSLISLSEEIHMVIMHGLLEELGKKIVKEKSRKWSRVWLHEHFYNVKLENMENKVEAICFGTVVKQSDMITGEILSKMSHLKLLILRGVDFLQNLSCLSNELRYMEWYRYPLKYLPSSFQPNHLVELILRYSNIKQLWKDKKYFPHLRSLDLSHSKNLKKMPDFRGIPNLERLSFEGCVKLVRMDPFIGILKRLVFLNLKDCENLASIPNNIFGLSSLECVNLSGCPNMFRNQRLVNISENASHYQSTMSSILKWTTFSAHKNLGSCSLPFFISFSSLVKLDISFCGLSQLPDAIGCLRWLEELNLGGNNFIRLPSLEELYRLAFLNLEHCKLLESLPQLPFFTSMDRVFQRNKKGLVIFNCPKLSEREVGSTINFSWMTRFIQANQVFTSIYDQIWFVVPGSEIPSWCNNQSEGHSIRIDLSPIMPNNENNVCGIACCAVFSAAPLDPRAFRDNIQNKRSQQISGIQLAICTNKISTSLCGVIPVILQTDLIEIKSDHMCLIYFPLKAIFYFLVSKNKTLSHLDHCKLDFEHTRSINNNCTVQKCGYHWVYKQDHESLSNLLSSEVKVFGN
ncbi:unnamed protein product [Lathyrus sativus]|nr:unnamed protein product [Lathyrus sativus]